MLVLEAIVIASGVSLALYAFLGIRHGYRTLGFLGFSLYVPVGVLLIFGAYVCFFGDQALSLLVIMEVVAGTIWLCLLTRDHRRRQRRFHS